MPSEIAGKRMLTGRREFLQAAGGGALLLMAACRGTPTADRQTPAAAHGVRIASNPGLENATLNELMRSLGYLGQMGVDAEIIDVPGAAGPVESIVAGTTDICIVSGYSRILPDIEAGAPLRIVGAAMLLPAHAVYARGDAVQSVDDLVGRTFGVGEENGLLHTLAILRLRKAGIDPASVRFVDRGSNADVYAAIVAGEVDAGLASVSNLAHAQAHGVRLVPGGELWKELPEYTFQTAYASERAIAANRQGLVRTLAAYSRLYRYLQGPVSKGAFFAARRAVQPRFDEASATATWNFIQDSRPYAVDLVVSEERIEYLQDLNLSLGIQKRRLPYSQVADMSLAREAVLLAREADTGR